MGASERAFRGGEYPDTLASCHGYSAPTGIPIILELGAPSGGQNVKVSSSSVSEDGSQVETCAYDATSYANPDGYQQTRLREGLPVRLLSHVKLSFTPEGDLGAKVYLYAGFMWRRVA